MSEESGKRPAVGIAAAEGPIFVVGTSTGNECLFKQSHGNNLIHVDTKFLEHPFLQKRKFNCIIMQRIRAFDINPDRFLVTVKIW